ncbi:hypothetical protein BpHYR1_049327 [Brachionus plicatilis]|uniref:Uncharacterized protein n=1 Tax=Brachionus plicatilis TaxID=10195 RepID=A0A3M7SGB7_BRAPC|nr:hypothetical protein BpHYR1_049327 [Brachionus plicatilis]
MDIPKYDMTLRAVDLQKFIYYMKMTMKRGNIDHHYPVNDEEENNRINNTTKEQVEFLYKIVTK